MTRDLSIKLKIGFFLIFSVIESNMNPINQSIFKFLVYYLFLGRSGSHFQFSGNFQLHIWVHDKIVRGEGRVLSLQMNRLRQLQFMNDLFVLFTSLAWLLISYELVNACLTSALSRRDSSGECTVLYDMSIVASWRLGKHSGSFVYGTMLESRRVHHMLIDMVPWKTPHDLSNQQLFW